MSEENKKIVIVIGAGASCDFSKSHSTNSPLNHGKIKYEIYEDLNYIAQQKLQSESRDLFPKYFLAENKIDDYAFPLGEALIKLIANQREIFSLFRNEILEEIYQDFNKKIDWNIENKDQEIIEFRKNYLKFFFEYLKKILNYHKFSKEKFEEKKIIFFEFFLGDLINKYYEELWGISNEIVMADSGNERIKNFNSSLEFKDFITKYAKLIREKNLQENKFLYDLFYNIYETDLSDFDSDLIYRVEELFRKENFIKNDSQNSTKPQELIQLFLKISNSFYLLISRLVNHYQPFTIDELLDSINRDKIDYLKPLDLNLEMADGVKKLKNILKDFENKTSEDHKNDNINELKNQFKNQLIKAGKTLIALFLLRSEKIELFTDFDAKIWYRHLRNLIISGKNEQEITKNIENLTIISFNYDRSLDYYLRTRLSNYYQKIQKRIYYPYGKLSQNDWDCEDYGKFNIDNKIFQYQIEDLQKIKKLGEGLRVIGELDEENHDYLNNKNFNRANQLKKAISDFEKYCIFCKDTKKDKPSNVLNREISELEELIKSEKDDIIKCEINFILEKYKTLLALHESCKIYFLGFAFHQQNCDLLQLKNFYQNREVFWTNFDASIAIDNKVDEIFSYQKNNDNKKFHPSSKKGVYEAMIFDFRLDFNSKFPLQFYAF